MRLETSIDLANCSIFKSISRVRLIAIGNRATVTELINRLHRSGIEVPMWTPAQPIPNTDEVVRICSENRSANRSAIG